MIKHTRNKESHYLLCIYDEKDNMLDFERIGLKTLEGSYKHFLKFVSKYKLENYERSYRKTNNNPSKIVIKENDYNNEITLIVITYEQFKNDLKTI